LGAYLRPREIGEALGALAAGGPAGTPWVIVAGATDHYPARVGLTRDEDVLDVSALQLRGVTACEAGWSIAALTTWTDLAESSLPPLFDGFRRAARTIGGLQVQNRATIAGNVGNASPAADGVPNLLALDAEVELRSAFGTRRMPVATFITGNRTTERRPDELIAGFEIPDGPPEAGLRTRSTFVKLGSRAYLVISIAMVAAVVEIEDDGTIARARIAVGACSEVARRLPELEEALRGVAIAEARDVPAPKHLAGLAPIDDVRGSASYRRDAALELVRRALEELAQ
jgi:CO/xanthine dehydrogenase FAD-binding subunit